MTTRIAVTGAAGRMGRMLIEAIDNASELVLTAALERPDSSLLGADAGELAGVGKRGVPLSADLAALADRFDVLIDFTAPDATVAHAGICAEAGRALVIGTTGLAPQQQAHIDAAAERVAVCQASNYSTGVNLCFQLLELAARVLGEESDIEIYEAHHRHKVDAPSGTALLLGRAVAEPLGKELSEDGVFCRHGIIGNRKDGTIGFSTVRGGDIAGEHTVMFIGDAERLEITHRATDRKIFAHGAVKAAKWLSGQPAGLYDMNDVLGLG